MDGSFSDFTTMAGANFMAEQKDNTKPWFSRWYVWVLPALVGLGALIFGSIF
jgi:hypothetical protein